MIMENTHKKQIKMPWPVHFGTGLPSCSPDFVKSQVWKLIIVQFTSYMCDVEIVSYIVHITMYNVYITKMYFSVKLENFCVQQLNLDKTTVREKEPWNSQFNICVEKRSDKLLFQEENF